MRGILLVAALCAGCWSSSGGAKDPAPLPDPKPSDPPPDPAIAMLTSVVVVEACPEAKTIDTKRATREIDELVGPCKQVPGGSAHFAATLLPDGRVELASPTGDPTMGVVPTCLMQKANQLKHKLRLKQACKFDVKLEQRGEQR
ncbi:MAG TPA: hypothetical protein VMZ53_08490 [Kofleriaceae bacterium]|nr:hypothetical protein [Kofleriaceae bacterium]